MRTRSEVAGAALVREDLLGRGLVVEEVLAHPSAAVARVSFVDPAGVRGFVVVSARPGPDEASSSLRAVANDYLAELLPRLRHLDDAELRSVYAAASNADVARLGELSARTGVEVEYRGSLLPPLFAHRGPADGTPPSWWAGAESVALALGVLSEVASGAPLEWALRRA